MLLEKNMVQQDYPSPKWLMFTQEGWNDGDDTFISYILSDDYQNYTFCVINLPFLISPYKLMLVIMRECGS